VYFKVAKTLELEINRENIYIYIYICFLDLFLAPEF